jgi:hypothetical protein
MIIVSVIGKSLLLLVVAQMVIHTLLHFHYLLSVCCLCTNRWCLDWLSDSPLCVCVCMCSCMHVCLKCLCENNCNTTLLPVKLSCKYLTHFAVFSLNLLSGWGHLCCRACVVNPGIQFVLSLDCVLSRERWARHLCTHIAPKFMRNWQ